MTVLMADQIGRAETRKKSPTFFHRRLAAPGKWRKPNGPRLIQICPAVGSHDLAPKDFLYAILPSQADR